MSNASKAKGTRYESEIRDFLNARGFSVRRVAQMGRLDHGDLHGYPLHIIEAKSVKSIDLPAFVRQADKEAINAGEPFGVCFVKKTRGATADGYAVRSVATDIRLIRRMRDMEEALKDAAFDRWYDIDEEHRRAAA
ncbi:hypothetical protein ACIPJG_32435 [Streptomyces halstedii]|uniref:hypothetical protein n=1 Tax=Streptomyces halstedii TaxID=1944 RepID=UPI00380F80DE